MKAPDKLTVAEHIKSSPSEEELEAARDAFHNGPPLVCAINRDRL